MKHEKEVLDTIECSNNFWHFYGYCKSYDVNDVDTPIKPCPEWSYLERLKTELDDLDMMIVYKTRQLYISTFGMIDLLHKLLYSDKPLQLLVLSEKLALAYDGTKTSLLGRLRFAYDNLPAHLKQTISIKTHPQVVFSNPANGVTIIGSATAPDTGRGNSWDEVWVDEYAFHDPYIAKELLSSLIPNSRKIRVVSTPRGRNHYYRLIQDAWNKKNKFVVCDYDYKDLGLLEEDKARYDFMVAMCEKMLPADREREMNRSFDETQEGRVFDFIKEDLIINEPIPAYGDIMLKDKVGGMDFGIGDDTALTLGFKEGEECRIYYTFAMNNLLPEAFYDKVVLDLMELFGCNEIQAKQLLRDTEIYCDMSGNNRIQTHDTTLIKDYRKVGLTKLKPAPRVSIKDGILSIHKKVDIKTIKEYNSVKLSVIDNLYLCHYPTSRTTGVITSYDKYEHDSTAFSSHIVDAVRYLCYCLSRNLGLYSHNEEVKTQGIHNSRIKTIQDIIKTQKEHLL